MQGCQDLKYELQFERLKIIQNISLNDLKNRVYREAQLYK